MERIVWTNGCFDVLHMGHIELFRYAKPQGTKLYVGVDSDEKVKQDKGQDRPFNNLNDRIQFLRAIRYVDKVIPFNSTQHLEETIKNISPDVMVIGADWRGKVVVGDDPSTPDVNEAWEGGKAPKKTTKKRTTKKKKS